MRLLYSCLLYFLTPFVLARLCLRGWKAPAYLRRWGERFGFYPVEAEKGAIWFHAVSVGEAEAAFPLVRAVQERFPGQSILLTTTTPTGSARVASVLGRAVAHVYLPYDLPCCVRRFLTHFQPLAGVIMETEIWPNLFHHCGQRKIPLAIVNARLSEKSALGYQKVSSFVQRTLSHVSLLAAQTQQDAERFMSLGMDPRTIHVTGSIKFDMELPASLPQEAGEMRQKCFQRRLVWLCASTHPGEDEQLLWVFKNLKRQFPTLLLILAPRHPERSNKIASLCKEAGLPLVKRTDRRRCDSHTDVFLLNTLGELKLFYAASDIAFVGGSLVPTGGHNIIEPAAAGIPVLYGPHMFNFSAIARSLKKTGAAVQIADSGELGQCLGALLKDEKRRAEMGARGRSFVAQNQGALAELMRLLEPFMAGRKRAD